MDYFGLQIRLTGRRGREREKKRKERGESKS